MPHDGDIAVPPLPEMAQLYPLRRHVTAQKRASASLGRRHHRRWRVQQLGRFGRAHQVRQAAARQRSAPAHQRAVDLVFDASRPRAAGRATRQRRRRDAGRRAAHRARPQRHAGLGLHQHRPRRAGPLHREDQSRQPQGVSDARGLASLRIVRDGDHRQGRGCAQDRAAAHAPRSRAAGLLSQPRRACWGRATWRRCNGRR